MGRSVRASQGLEVGARVGIGVFYCSLAHLLFGLGPGLVSELRRWACKKGLGLVTAGTLISPCRHRLLSAIRSVKEKKKK